VQLAAIAGAILQTIWLIGQFHGVIRPHTSNRRLKFRQRCSGGRAYEKHFEAALLTSSGRTSCRRRRPSSITNSAKLGLHFRARSWATKRFVMTDAHEAGQAAGERFEYRPGLAAGV